MYRLLFVAYEWWVVMYEHDTMGLRHGHSSFIDSRATSIKL